MKNPQKTLLLASIIFFLSGCSDGENSQQSSTPDPIVVGSSNDTPSAITHPNPIPISSTKKDIQITKDNQIVYLGKGSKIKSKITITNGAKDIYILVSNEDNKYTSEPIIKHNKSISFKEYNRYTKESIPTIYAKRAKHAPAHILAFAKDSKKILSKTVSIKKEKRKIQQANISKKDTLGSNQIFYISKDTKRYTRATARKVIQNIDTKFGNKTLSIWVSDNSFGNGCFKTKCITQNMVDALADTFLKEGENNDIYDWVTNIYGQEWDSNASIKYPGLIEANNEITILLTDIDEDDSENGGTIGYFYPKDNFKKSDRISGSNERLMFYIDSVMFANEESERSWVWSIDNPWPKETVATLAHEFVHMIHFYQKTLMRLNDDEMDTDIWINEMMAESTEDLIATKIKSLGPRGVVYTDGSAGEPNNNEGRYGLFNRFNTLSLTKWNDKLEDYSKVNAFGAYLIRNYGGAKLLHDIMHNGYGDEQAIIDAVNKANGISGKNFANLQREWGIAVLLSDQKNLNNKTVYNSGDFISTEINGVVYQMGSINFFNYIPAPKIYTSTSLIPPQANYFYKVGDNITGLIDIDLTLNNTTSATLIAKDSK